ncbi:GNAT family N-acetyltransferase [Taibaiella koreensis]|uniref:GNAT family N-acetyltransferase n=1 Tax=Taibaiella koreensis TaxID=1268548 RepID=UPI000E59BC35|nr:GNAT family N-acetyltransferase [Taibaiella koreensis]
MDIKIREAQEHDLPQILDIYNDAILYTTSVYNYKPHTLDMRREWFRLKQQDGFPVCVAELEERAIGFGTYGPFRPWAAYKYTAEISVYIDPTHRGKGIARLLYPHLLAAAQQQQLHALVAGIDAANEASMKLHRHFGFVEVGRFKEVGYKFGQWLDLVFMQLLLPTPEHPTED